jgi:peptidoglycan hydrolase-like protein with peptidoglycan-binding domain
VVAALVVVALVVGGAGGWALRTVLAPAPDVLGKASYTVAEAKDGTVGQEFQLATTATWKRSSSVPNRSSGTVTSIELTGGERVASGDVLYRVDLRPVVAVEGKVPAFRDIGSGDAGADVEQLQELLVAKGYLHVDPDGKAGASTVGAIKAWQHDLGVKADGVARLGDVVFVPRLPSSLSLEGITVGSQIGSGTGSVGILGAVPDFTISITQDQAAMIPEGTRVDITHGKETWKAKVDHVDDNGDSLATAVLAPVGDDPICGSDCGRIPVKPAASLDSDVVVVPKTSGVVVPTSALTTADDGGTVVVTDAGTVLPVKVTASAKGSSVDEGVTAGTHVRTPGVLPDAGGAA